MDWYGCGEGAVNAQDRERDAPKSRSVFGEAGGWTRGNERKRKQMNEEYSAGAVTVTGLFFYTKQVG